VTAPISNMGLHSHPMLDTVVGMDTTPWRERVEAEEQLMKQLEAQTSDAAKRRAAALTEGVAELGSVYAVAKVLGRSHTAIANAIKRHAPEA
jgi:hypothetical protein